MITKEEFECMGIDISFIPYGNNPEDEVDGLAFTYEEVNRIKEALKLRDI